MSWTLLISWIMYVGWSNHGYIVLHTTWIVVQPWLTHFNLMKKFVTILRLNTDESVKKIC